MLWSGDGRVVDGDARGRALGFPTANIDLSGSSNRELPSDGVYVGRVTLVRPGDTYFAALSLGRRPTFYPGDNAPRLLEAHILDFTDEIYGEPVTVVLDAKLRDQERFTSVDELIAQMEIDVAAARAHAAQSAEASRERGPA
jgi:riboflavin kinase/FMN adenylyltransferase